MKSFKLNIAKKEVEFFETSFKPYGLSCMSNPAFLNNVIDFGKFGKDKINEETIEFLVPYLEIEGFNPQARRRTLSHILAEGVSERLSNGALERSVDIHRRACCSKFWSFIPLCRNPMGSPQST